MKCLLIFAACVIGSIAANLSEFTTSTVGFTFDFLQRAFVPTQNVVLSPISIQSTLSMLYPLAGDKVSPVMQRTLHLPTDKNLATSNLSGFLRTLNMQNGTSTSATVRILSKLYHVNVKLKPLVEPLFASIFEVETEAADFRNQTEVAASINGWINQASNGLIEQLLTSDEVSVETSLTLLNVVTLNASWEEPFSAIETATRTFHFVNGDHPVEMMSMQEELLYASMPDSGCEAVELLYEDGTDLSMVILLPMPQKSLDELIRGMDVKLYEQINERLLTRKRINLAIPKFSIQKQIDAKGLLRDMGLTALFDEADLDVFVQNKTLVTDIKQTATIKVDEEGTEASASTLLRASLRSSYPTFYANRPFLFLIRKPSTKDIIFIGCYSVHEHL